MIIENYIGGRTNTIVQPASTGVANHAPGGSQSSYVFNADETKQFGKVECWTGKIIAAADVAYDAAGAVFDILGTKPTLPCSYRVLRIDTVLRVLRTGGTPDHDLKIALGDGAASEAFTDIVATVDIDSDTVGLPTTRILVPTVQLITTGRTLRLQLQVSGTTTTGTAEVEFYIYVIPANA